MEGMSNNQAKALVEAIIQILQDNGVNKAVIDKVQRIADTLIGE